MSCTTQVTVGSYPIVRRMAASNSSFDGSLVEDVRDPGLVFEAAPGFCDAFYAHTGTTTTQLNRIRLNMGTSFKFI